MASFKTTMLRAGTTYHSGDTPVVVTRERLQHWAKSNKRLREVGYTAPMHYDHSSDPDMQVPIEMDAIQKKAGRSAANSIGFLDKIDLSDDGNAAELTYKIIDDKVANQLDEGVVHLSPIILNKFQDGAKNQYGDIIGHLDVVNYPVDYSQSAAKRSEVAVAMGLETGSTPADVIAIKFSAKDLSYREDFAVAMGLPMGKDEDGDDMPDKGMDKENMDEMDGKESMPSEKPETPEATSGDVGAVVDLLRKIGLGLPVDTDGSNFIDRLSVALPVYVEANPLFESEMDDGGSKGSFDTFGNQKNGDRVVAEHELATALSLQNQEETMADEKLQAYADTQYREKQSVQLGLMLANGQMTPAEHKEHSTALNAIKLSLVDGVPEANSVTDFIKNREAVPKGAFWTDERKVKEQTNKTTAEHDEAVKMSANPEDEDKAKTKNLSPAEAHAYVESLKAK